MTAGSDAPFGGLSGDYARRIEQLEKMRCDLGEVSATAARPDGLVAVVVGAGGRVEDIRLDPRVYRKLDTGELASSLLELISEATATVTEQMRDIMAPFTPMSLADGSTLGEEGDFTSYFPKPPDADGTESRKP